MSDPSRLQHLDDLLSALRLAVQRPGYRRRLLQDLDVPGGITGLRLLRAVQALSGDGSPSIKDVAGRLAVEHSTASRGVDSAVRDGSLRKQPCSEDQRRTRLELTPAGTELLERTADRRGQIPGTVTEHWDEGDLARLVELLAALKDGYDRLEEPR